ncbi:RNA polymerase sigma factor [Rhodococcus sp. LB1]|uniref:RNA polymerase sigma factor n=1 Tax=Rhodococcus sp. LB1 TaxID=1807499 RepID=UPI00077A7E5F|nr:RNA polymerase sigma factor [Rhodococcus sp. LB1]KXX62224.1 RNA polymerase subunit sigma-24 [Rhodococcus sp. LB1]
MTSGRLTRPRFRSASITEEERMTEIDTSHEQFLVDALRARDESAFAELVDLHTPMMLRVARGYVASAEVAEDVVQETWIAVLQGIDRFEGRSTLRTWLFRILVNIAKKRGVRDRHDVDAALAAYTGSASVDPARFLPASSPEDPHHWATPPTSWPETPEGSVLGAEVLDVAGRELEHLPDRQRIVVVLRDVLGYDAEEVSAMLAITPANQRVLLHRGRAHVRQALEDYLGTGA